MRKAKLWLENFWYHYKWPVIIGAFFIVVFAICVTQMATRSHYDMYVRYVGDAVITDTQYNDIVASLGKMDYDSNNDGKTEVNFAQVAYVSDDKNPYKNDINANAKEVMSGMLVQPYYIYVMDKQAYELYKGKETFATLNQVFDVDTDLSDIAYDEFAVYFKDTAFCKNSPGMEWVDEDVLVVLKLAPYKSALAGTKYKSDAENFELHSKVFREMVGR
ncbi:MAG: hypothetical protein IJW76_01025 [Clostridia bacterium]|nr:hypothetical protein [Clostridia bacterium]